MLALELLVEKLEVDVEKRLVGHLVNKEYGRFADHYGAAIVPARACLALRFAYFST